MSAPRTSLLCAALLLCSLLALSGVNSKDPVHILYLTDCTMYSDWQTVGMAFSFRNSGQKGHITRVMCCTDEEKARYNQDMLELMPSHIAPSFAYNEHTKDHYAAYNKPGAVLDFMTKGTPLADYMLVIDSDMLLRHPFRPDIYNMTAGKAISADYTYMIGCTNDLAVRHIPDIPLRKDTLAGPYDRHCDMVGGYTFMGREDLTKVAPLWLSVTEDVREDPEAWRLSGDQYVEKGGKPWISEMYGYSFACAKSNVWHTWDTQVMHYPTYSPQGVPKLMHYGLQFTVDDYQFDKHWHYQFDVAKCAPWDMTGVKDRKGGLFPHPPRPSTLSQKGTPILYFRDLLSVETVSTINAGLCHYHLAHCPPSQQMLDECTVALDIYKETMVELRKIEAEMARSKGLPNPNDSHDQPEVRPATKELEEGLKELARKLREGGQAQHQGQAQAQGQQQAEGGEVQAPQPHANVHERRAEHGAHEVQQQQQGGDQQQQQQQQVQPQAKTNEEILEDARRQALQLASKHLREVQAQGQAQTSGEKVNSNARRLSLSCYRMALTMQEVRDCLAAAEGGKEYSWPARKLASSAEDSKLTQHEEDVQQLPHAQQPDSARLRIVQRNGSLQTYQLGTWEMLGVWLLGVFILLVFVPRWILRFKRRLKAHSKHFE